MGLEIKMTVDNREKVLAYLKSSCTKALEECGLTAEGYAKKLCAVDTGALRNSIAHQVDEEAQICYVGSDQEYAAYIELGTGKYYDGGRQTPWVYQDDKGNWHWTDGNKAQPFLKPAVADHASAYKEIIERRLRNG